MLMTVTDVILTIMFQVNAKALYRGKKIVPFDSLYRVYILLNVESRHQMLGLLLSTNRAICMCLPCL